MMFGLGNIATYALIAVAAIGAAVAYDEFIDDPAVREETRLVERAQAEENFKEALGEISDDAERARAMLRYCASVGRVYDFAENRCREA